MVLAGCGAGGGAKLGAGVAKRLAVAKASRSPAYWLGARYDGLQLVRVESGSDAFFTSSLYYADCSWFDLESLSPHCHRSVEVDNDVPAQGEITSMGRCTFSTSVDGVTVATFPVNPRVLRVFARGATVYVSAESRASSLQAVAALQPLNGHRLAHRDVSSALGACRARRSAPRASLTAKQRYERRMRRTFFVQSIATINLNGVDPAAARPRTILREFLSNTRVLSAILRNEAYRVAQIPADAPVAALHARLVAQLRAYAAELDRVLADARRDGLDEAAWVSDTRVLQPRVAAATAAIGRTVRAFKARGYSVFVKPTD